MDISDDYTRQFDAPDDIEAMRIAWEASQSHASSLITRVWRGPILSGAPYVGSVVIRQGITTYVTHLVD